MSGRFRRLAERGCVARAVAAFERLERAPGRFLRVLTYHRVDEASPFARQMEHLAAHYHVVSPAQVLTALDGGPALPERAVLLTFDDGHASFARVAWPILARHGFAAVLFVPTAFPDGDQPRFWWDRLREACARTARREPLETPAGLLPLASPAQRSQAAARLERRFKELPHPALLASVDALCAELDQRAGPHEVLGWDELRALVRQGLVPGAHSRTHPRLDRVARAEARAEILGSLADLERELPGVPRLFAYPDGRCDDELADVVRAAGVELAFTTRRGIVDLHACDRARLPRIHADARDPLPVFRARLAYSGARLRFLVRLLDPPSPGERRAARAERRSRRRNLVQRALDALLTAELRPRETRRASLGRVLARGSHYGRLGRLTRLVLTGRPALARRLAKALLDPSRLPFRAARLRLVGFGSGATVFRLAQGSGSPALALKLYRRTLGRAPAQLACVARRHRQRYRRLRAHFGALVLPAEFLVLHGPLRARAALACVQPFLEGPRHDLLALHDEALLALLRVHGLAESFATFARAALAWRRQGSFPDLFGSHNLLLHEAPGRPELWLIDYGVLELREVPAADALHPALATLAERLESLVTELAEHAAQARRGEERDALLHA